MEGMDREKVRAYMEEKDRLNIKTRPSSSALWFLNLVNRIFKTAFMEGPEDYLTVYERGRAKVRLLSTLSTREKIAVGLKLGQFYSRFQPKNEGLLGCEEQWPTHLMFKDWDVSQQENYHQYWDAQDVGHDPVLSGSIAGDYPQDQFTLKEEAELDNMRELGRNWGPGEDVPRHWSTNDLLPRAAG